MRPAISSGSWTPTTSLSPSFWRRLAHLSAARPDLDILTTDARFVVDGRSDGTFYEKNAFPIDDQRMAMLCGCFITTKTAVRRSRLLEVGGFDARLKHGEDWECWLRLVLSGSRVGLVDAPLSRYHLHEGQMSARRGESLRGRLNIMTSMRTSPELTDAERSRLAEPLRKLRIRAAMASAVDGDVQEARRIWFLLARTCQTSVSGSSGGAARCWVPSTCQSRRPGAGTKRKSGGGASQVPLE